MVKAHELVLAKACGFEYVELSGKAVAAMENSQFHSLLKKLESAAIPCAGLNAYCDQSLVIAGPGVDAQKTGAYAKHLADRAAKLGVKIVGIGSPMSRRLPEEYDRKRAWQEARDFFRITADAFAPKGISVGIEALAVCYCNFLNTTQEAIDMAQVLDMENLGVIADLYNMEMMGEAEAKFTDASRIIHAHISDDDGSPQRRYFLLPSKERRYIISVRHLMDMGYQGNLTIEIDLPVDEAQAETSLSILRKAENKSKE